DDVVVAFPVTLQLALALLLLASALGVPIGVLSAVWRGSRFDAAVMTLTLFGVSMPIFWLGLMLLVLFAAGVGRAAAGGLVAGWGGAAWGSVSAAHTRYERQR